MATNLLFHLARDVLRLSGQDRRAFLQGLISNDIELCQLGKPIYAALLTPQGKYRYDFFVTDLGNDFLIDVEAGCGAELIPSLIAYKLRSKILIEDVSALYSVWATLDTRLATTVIADTLSWTADPRHVGLGCRVIMPKSAVPEGEIAADNGLYDRHLIQFAAPRGQCDLELERSTIQEANLDRLNAVSWTKGCYIGQELTARLHYRALVKKRLIPVRVEGTAPPAGTPIMHDGVEIGTMRGACGDLGLACLNLDVAVRAIDEGITLAVGDTKIVVLPSPLLPVKDGAI